MHIPAIYNLQLLIFVHNAGFILAIHKLDLKGHIGTSLTFNIKYFVSDDIACNQGIIIIEMHLFA